MLLKVELAERWGSSRGYRPWHDTGKNDGSIRGRRRIGLTLQRCRWLSVDVIMVLLA